MKIEDVDLLLGLPRGAFDHIPRYCRKEALEAIAYVRRMEEQQLLRSGVYYVVLSDLCGATLASEKLGSELNRRRVESFITLSVESLGTSKPDSYAHFVKPAGDAVLFLFSAFTDLHSWWKECQDRMLLYSSEWNRKLDSDSRSIFQLRSKTVFHVGEVGYSDDHDPVAAAVNQVFKVEKIFKAGELGCTELAKVIASPLFPDCSLTPRAREEVILPGIDAPMMTWVIAEDERAKYDLA